MFCGNISNILCGIKSVRRIFTFYIFEHPTLGAHTKLVRQLKVHKVSSFLPLATLCPDL